MTGLAASEAPAAQSCNRCGKLLPLTAFVRETASGETRVYKTCNACATTAQAWRQAKRASAPESVRRANLKQLYGITPEQYDELRTAQEHRCAICRRHESEIPRSQRGRPPIDGRKRAPAATLHVDHDHTDGRIRGLLCHTCNSALGLMNDQVAWLQAAVAYLSTARSA